MAPAIEAMKEQKEYDYIQQWKNILDTDVLRSNINLIAMYIMVYELLEDIIISKPKDFYTLIEFDEEAERKYKDCLCMIKMLARR